MRERDGGALRGITVHNYVALDIKYLQAPDGLVCRRGTISCTLCCFLCFDNGRSFGALRGPAVRLLWKWLVEAARWRTHSVVACGGSKLKYCVLSSSSALDGNAHRLLGYDAVRGLDTPAVPSAQPLKRLQYAAKTAGMRKMGLAPDLEHGLGLARYHRHAAAARKKGRGRRVLTGAVSPTLPFPFPRAYGRQFAFSTMSVALIGDSGPSRHEKLGR